MLSLVNIFTADKRRRGADIKEFFAWAIRLRLKATTGQALPRQKLHAFQAQAPIVSRSDCCFCFRKSRRQNICVRQRLSSERSERAVNKKTAE